MKGIVDMLLPTGSGGRRSARPHPLGPNRTMSRGKFRIRRERLVGLEVEVALDGAAGASSLRAVGRATLAQTATGRVADHRTD